MFQPRCRRCSRCNIHLSRRLLWQRCSNNSLAALPASAGGTGAAGAAAPSAVGACAAWCHASAASADGEHECSYAGSCRKGPVRSVYAGLLTIASLGLWACSAYRSSSASILQEAIGATTVANSIATVGTQFPMTPQPVAPQLHCSLPALQMPWHRVSRRTHCSHTDCNRSVLCINWTSTSTGGTWAYAAHNGGKDGSRCSWSPCRDHGIPICWARSPLFAPILGP